MKSAKQSIVIIIIGLLVLATLAIAGYIYFATEFERDKPIVHSSESIFWNRKEPLKIKLTDNRELKDFKLILSDDKNSIIIGQGTFENGNKVQTLLVRYPQGKVLNPKAQHLTLKISVKDSSLWNFFQGNEAEKTVDIQIDYKQPNVNILANSYSITQGGSALVVFQAEDNNIDRVYIEAIGKKFKAQPYKKEGYYAALIAWPFTQTDFSAKIIVTDLAKNRRVTDISFYQKKRKYRVSFLRAKDKFIDGKISDLIASDPEYSNIDNRLEKLKAINETMRLKNEDLIHGLSSHVSAKMIDSWKIDKFYPLKNGAKVASYGDERYYYYKTKDNKVSHSYHVGLDLASTKMAIIKTSNSGSVVYADDNGIYGNMPMIDHGLGLYTLYGHCSQLLVEEGDEVSAGQAVAKTGVSGLALGDHLHFGILVQGIEVRPVEWFDKSWIRKNIDNIFNKADKIIMAR